MVPISVVMPVFNTAEEYLKEAVDSILGQTFEEFEYIILDDGSDRQETTDYLASLDDPRIRIIRNPENIGITKTLNIGLREAKGKYIVRMDSDDISLPDRFEKQFAFMEAHPDAFLCGTQKQCFGNRSFIRKRYIDDRDLFRIRLLFYNAGPAHPTVMYRRQFMIEDDLWYDESLKYAQDYGMWVDASNAGVNLYCLEEVLVLYRLHEEQVSVAKRDEQKRCGILIQMKQLRWLLGDVSEEDAWIHNRYYESKTITEEAGAWFVRLKKANYKKGVYDRKKFDRFVNDLILNKLYATYDIKWKRLGSYTILFHYLPLSVIIREGYGRIRMRIREWRHRGR